MLKSTCREREPQLEMAVIAIRCGEFHTFLAACNLGQWSGVCEAGTCVNPVKCGHKHGYITLTFACPGVC